jgi:glycosyltransferase involved in cell wall biosynthesis
MSKAFLLSVVIPAFNESENIHHMLDVLENELVKYDNYEVIIVDDGSSDNSLEVIKEQHRLNNRFNYISLSRNFGHQFALKAGLDNSKGDCVISMDGDLQHPPELIHQMIDLWLAGNDVVYTIREDGDDVTNFKKRTASFFYFLVNKIADVKITKGAADFRLLDRKVVNIISSINDAHLFLRGVIPWIGFKQVPVKYKANKRFAGESKYTFFKMFKFATNGITSFSVKPLQLSIYCGFIISSLAFVYGIYAIFISLFTNIVISGWTSMIASVLFLGGIQLIFAGIIGEYIGRIFIQTKNRPNYIVKETSLTHSKEHIS